MIKSCGLTPFQAIPQSDAAKKARLRRVCEKKPSGKLHCPEWLHELWLNPNNREDLIEKFESVGWKKEGAPAVHASFAFA